MNENEEKKQKFLNAIIDNQRKTKIAIKDFMEEHKPEQAVLIVGKHIYDEDRKDYRFILKIIDIIHPDFYTHFIKGLGAETVIIRQKYAKEHKIIRPGFKP